MAMTGDNQSMKLARTIYWLSLLLLIVGGRVLIDPSDRAAGETLQIYITLAAFEIYMWLLLALGRWQHRNQLGNDVVRSGLFVIGLQGLTFVALNEMHMASSSVGVVLSIVATVLALAKLAIACRWLEFRLPYPLAGLAAAWILLMCASGLIFASLPEGSAQQQTAAYVLCWIAASLAAAHALIAAWGAEDIRRRQAKQERWWIAWLASGSLGLMALVQIYSSRFGFYVDFPLGFLTPTVAAAAVAGVVLATAAGVRGKIAWGCMGASALVILVVRFETPTPVNEAPWMSVANGFFVHPLYPAGVLASLLAISTGLRLRSRPLLVLGIGVFLIAGVWRLTMAIGPAVSNGAGRSIRRIHQLAERILSWEHAQGVLLLCGAFVTLGIGVWLQRRTAVRAKTAAPEPEPHWQPVQDGLEGTELVERLVDTQAKQPPPPPNMQDGPSDAAPPSEPD
jgi:hypothetical protein